MQETRHKFYELTDRLLSEKGLLANRPTWIKLRQFIQDSGPETLATYSRSHTDRLLLVLLTTPEKSAQRKKELEKLMDAACNQPPDSMFIELLKQLAPDDLVVTLLPQIYCDDSRGTVAVYLAAKAGLLIEPESFQYFLTARTWEQTDLINLAMLVRPAEHFEVSAILEKAAANATSPMTCETFTEFRHILLGSPPEHPLIPDICAVTINKQTVTREPSIVEPSTDNLTSAKEAPADEQPTQAAKEPDSQIQPVLPRQQVDSHLRGRPTSKNQIADNTNLIAQSKSLIENNQGPLIFLFTITTLVILATSLSKWVVSEKHSPLQQRVDAERLPPHWTDSASNETITERYLAADKDYRMGELYLTRDRYSEALILFEDALAIRPEHTQALYRVGYCRLHIKDYAGAKAALEKALKLDPRFRHANLMLARAAFAQSDNQNAEIHFKNELELADDPAVAEEYANFLHNIGRENEAQQLIDRYQAMYPDRLLILTRKPDSTDSQEQRQ